MSRERQHPGRERGDEREQNEWIKIQCREGDESKTTIFSAGGAGGWDVVVELRPCGNCGFFWESDGDTDSIYVPHTHVFSNTKLITLTCSGSSDCACRYRIREVSKH